jgi:hypothetical protein
MRPKVLLTLLMAAAVLGVFVPGAVGSGASAHQHIALRCDVNGMLCTEPLDPYTYEGTYIGHDEPSLLFYSNTAGAGNNQQYQLQIPVDSTKLPTQDGSGGTWNFQLRPTFWFGMALCDDQSAPNPGGSKLAGPNVPCQPDSDSNIYTGLTPTQSGGTNYFGQHPGTAFMELQLYPPGWASADSGITESCSGTQWCAAMTIDSDALNENTNQFINSTCADQLFGGTEYVNFAYLTHSGTPLGPPNPLQVDDASFNIGSSDLLRMNPGDQLTVDLHDTAHGLQTVISDSTTGQTGTMTASAANGFGAIQYAPKGKTCNLIPYDFHPMYSTSSENTRVLWAAHGYNIAFSDEIGHWEYCNAVDFSVFPFPCTSAGAGESSVDADDDFCAPASVSLLVPVSGCTDSDEDFDGVAYQKVWPGISGSASTDTTPGPVIFSSPTFNGAQQYSRVAFETDLPRIEATGLSPNNNCQRFSPTGTGCVDPPNGAQFYPIYVAKQVGGVCRWYLGGPNFPGSTNNFGGTSTAEYGPLVRFDYPDPSGDLSRFNDFRNVLSSNPCPA